MANPLLNFVAGAGSGYVDQKRQEMMDDERRADRAQRDQMFNAQMDTINQDKKLRLGLADASRPVAVNDNAATLDMGDGAKVYQDQDVASSDMRQARGMGLADVKTPTQTFAVGQKSYGDRAAADAAAAQQNSPGAVTGRLADAYSAAGQPLKGIELQRNQTQYDREQNDFVKRAQQEGYAQTARAMLGGDAQQVFDTYNKQGKSKLKEPPTVTRADLKLDGIGTVPNYTYSGVTVDASGAERPFTMNSHDANMSLLPYNDRLTTMRQGSDSANKALYQSGLIEARNAAVDARLEVAKLRTDAGAGGNSREERLRATSMLNDANKGIDGTQKVLSKLQGDLLTKMAIQKNPDGPEAREVQDLRDTLKRHKENHEVARSLLAGSQSGGAPATASPAPSNARGPGIDTSGQREILDGEMAKAQALLAGGDTRAQGDINALNKEIKRLSAKSAPGLANSQPRTAAPNASGPVKVSSAAERDALARGTLYTAPNGQQYTKQ